MEEIKFNASVGATSQTNVPYRTIYREIQQSKGQNPTFILSRSRQCVKYSRGGYAEFDLTVGFS